MKQRSKEEEINHLLNLPDEELNQPVSSTLKESLFCAISTSSRDEIENTKIFMSLSDVDKSRVLNLDRGLSIDVLLDLVSELGVVDLGKEISRIADNIKITSLNKKQK